jgi:nucleotide-binding universal stress UspA family protein
MAQKILVAQDGSDNGQKALALAAQISAKMGWDLTIVHVLMHGSAADEMARMAEVEHVIAHTAKRVIPDSLNMPPTMAEFLDHPEADRARAVAEIGEYVLRIAQRAATEAGAKNVKTLLRDGDYGDGILDAADDIDADMIVIGRRGLGRLRGLVLGSVSNKVVQHAECSVLTVR